MLELGAIYRSKYWMIKKRREVLRRGGRWVGTKREEWSMGVMEHISLERGKGSGRGWKDGKCEERKTSNGCDGRLNGRMMLWFFMLSQFEKERIEIHSTDRSILVKECSNWTGERDYREGCKPFTSTLFSPPSTLFMISFQWKDNGKKMWFTVRFGFN